MAINETVSIKAIGSGLTRTVFVPLKQSFNVTDVSTLRLKNGATILPATFTVWNRWNGLPSDTSKPIKIAHVTFKDTSTPRTLTVDDAGGSVPAQTNPLSVANNANDFTVSNGIVSAVFSKVADTPDLLTSLSLNGTQVLHASNKPRLSVPTEKRTTTTWTSSVYDFAANPTETVVKVANTSAFSNGETFKFAWEGMVQDYYPTGGADSHPFVLIALPFAIVEMTRALMTSTHRVNIILNYGVTNTVVPIDYSNGQGFCLLSAPPITPTAGMKVRIQQVENEGTKTITGINSGASTITFSPALSNYLPQGVNVEPTVAASSTAYAKLVSNGCTIEKQYGDKAVIIKQTCVLKDGAAQVEQNLTIEFRTWLFADVGFVRQQITLRNTVATISTSACPPIFFNALNYDFPTAQAAADVSDAVTDMATSVARYKANNLHLTLNHSGVSNLQFAIHEFNVQWPNRAGVDSTGCYFEIFPATSGPISFEGGVIKSRNIFFGLNAGNGHTLLDTLGATYDPAYIASSKVVRPSLVEKRDWNTVFAAESQKFRDACARYERLMACVYDISVCEASPRPAQSLYEHRYNLQESGYGTYPFGWDKWGNTAEDVGFGNNRYDLLFCLFREGLRESDATKSALAWKLGLQQARNRVELGQMWNHQSQADGGPDMYGLGRYERAYMPNPFDYTNSPIANPTHSWNEGSCLYAALTDEPLAKEAAYAGVVQARQYNYQGTYGARLYGNSFYQMKDPATGEGSAEPRFVGWPIHTLITGYRYFGEAIDLQRAQEYSQSFLVTMAGEPVDDGFTHYQAYGTIAPLFQHGGYCMHGIIETWRESTGTTQSNLATYIGKVAKFLARGNQASGSVTTNSPLLTNGTAHPNDGTKYNPAVAFPFTWTRQFSTTLSASITSSQTTIPLVDATAFNTAPGQSYQNNSRVAVLIPAGQLTNPATWEYVSYTGLSGNTLTGVARNYGSSGAKAFSAGATVYPAGFGGAYNDIIVATLIMGARVTGDSSLQAIAQKVWEDNCLYRDQDPGNFVTVGTYQPINLWFRNVSSNSLKLYAQGATALSEFLADRINPASAPTISGLSPASITAGNVQFTLTVNGSNFAANSIVVWNSTNLTTTYVSATQLTAVVPASLVTTAGTAAVTVYNPTDALTSNQFTFTINAATPAPTISGISPNTATVNVATGAITITGTNLSSATVTVAGVSVTPTSNTATQIVLPSQTFNTTGSKTVQVTTAGGTTSTTISVSNPAPATSSLNPSSVTAGNVQFTLTVNGSNFVNGSVVRWNGTDLTTTFVSSTQLTATVPASLVTTAGTASVTVFTATPGGGTSSSLSFTISAAGPTITGISPSTAQTGVATGAITINGTNFTGASVTVDGSSVAPISLTASQIVLPSQTFNSTGTKTIVVTTGGGSTNTSITVSNPTPVQTSINPSSITVGNAQFTLLVTGSGFVSNSIVRWNGSDLATTFISATQLNATVPASLVNAVGTAAVTVFSPTPGGGTSSTITFTINAGATPTISTLAPASAIAGAAQFTLTVTGTNFASDAEVRVNGSARATTFVSATQLTAVIPATDVAAAGTLVISVRNVSTGAISTGTNFSVIAPNPAPTTSGLSPATVTAGATGFTLEVQGTNFVSASVIRINGVDRATTFVAANKLTCSVLPSEVAAAGALSITVFSPGPGGGTSSVLTLTITGAAPVIALLNPSALTTGGGETTVTLTGTGFASNVVIRVNGSPRTTTFVSSQVVRVTLTEADRASEANLALTADNPGGATSPAATLPVLARPPVIPPHANRVGRLVPESAVVYPNQTQRWDLLLYDSPAMWVGLSNGQVGSDYTLRPISTAANYLGYSVHRLASGLGSAAFTLTASWLPVGSGLISANLQDGVNTYLAWSYNAATLQLRIYNQAGTITTLNGARNVGDVIKIEVAGSVWRVLLNDVVVGQMTATAVIYPVFWSAGANVPLASNPAIPAPLLMGDWTAYYPADWQVTGGGNITTPGSFANFTAGSSPGIYTVSALYANSQYQMVTGTLLVPVLELAEQNPLTLQPGQKIRLQTNYPANLVTWSAAAGNGTFTAQPDQVYTAPTAAGTYTVKAMNGQQQVFLTIIVPFVVTPLNPYVAPGDTITFTSSDPNANYSASCGVVSGNQWTAPNNPSGSCLITVNSALLAQPVYITARIVEAFPFCPTLGYEAERSKTTLVRRAEDGTRKGRVKTSSQQAYELIFQNRELTEYQQAQAFWEKYFPDGLFLFRDAVLNINGVGYFDSALKHQANGDCDITYSFRFVMI